MAIEQDLVIDEKPGPDMPMQSQNRNLKHESRYRTILDNMQDAYYEVDLAGNHLFFNDALCTMLYFSRDELQGMNYREYTKPETAAVVYDVFNQVFRTGKPRPSFAFEITRGDGSLASIELSIALMYDEDGEPSGFQGIIRDNTERKQAEKDLKRAYEELEHRVAKRTAELEIVNAALQEQIAERNKAEASLENRAQLLETLSELSREASLELDFDLLLNTYIKLVGETLDATSVYISTWDYELGTTKVIADYYGPRASDKEKVSDIGIVYSLEKDFGVTADWIDQIQESLYIDFFDDPDMDPKERAHFERYGNKTQVGVPLRNRGKTFGILEIWESQEKREFTDKEIELAVLLGDQIATIYHNHFLYQQAQQEIIERKQTEEILKTLNEIAEETYSVLDLTSIFQRIVNFTGRFIGATSAYISRIDLEARTIEVVAEYFGPNAITAEKVSDLGEIYQIDDGFNSYTRLIDAGQDFYIIHHDDEDLPEQEKTHMDEYGAKSILNFVMHAKERPIAVLELWESHQKREFAQEQINLIRTVTNQISRAIENAELYEQVTLELQERRRVEIALRQSQEQIRNSLERRSREVELSTQVAREISSAPDLNELYKRVVSQVKEQFGFYHVQLLRYDPLLDSIILVAGYGQVGLKMMVKDYKVSQDTDLIGLAVGSGNSYLQADTRQDPNWRPNALLPDTKGELAVPIKLGNEVLGVLDVQSNEANALTKDDQLVLEGLCGQIAVAIESTRLRQEMNDRLEELNKLQQLMSREGWKSFRTRHEVESRGYLFDHTSTQPLVFDDTDGANGQVEAPVEAFKTGELRQIITTPLTIRGETIGTLAIQDEEDQPLTAEDRDLLDSISVQVAQALESARLLEQTQKNASDMETVAQVGTAASTILETQDLLQTVVTLTQERFALYFVSIFAMDEEEGLLTWVNGTQLPVSPDEPTATPVLAIDQEQSLIAAAGRTRKPIVANDVSIDPRFMPVSVLPDTRSELAIPLIIGDELLGVLDLQSNIRNRFSEDDIRIHTTLATQVAVAWKNAILYDEQLETAKRLRQVDRLKTEFMASMSHELRTPLNSIIGFSDVLLEGMDGPLTERMAEDVTLIRDSGRHLRELISEILDMSKIEAGMMALRHATVDVNQVAREVVANIRSLIYTKEIDVKLQLDPKVSTIEADRTRLLQILFNLMSNAIKFTNTGFVSLTLKDAEDVVSFAVQDTGIGIKESDIPIIFEQFRQIDGSLTRKAGGTGLGMPISKSLVELHGGEMFVESQPGKGSTFTFTIPKKRPAIEKPTTGSLANLDEI